MIRVAKQVKKEEKKEAAKKTPKKSAPKAAAKTVSRNSSPKKASAKPKAVSEPVSQAAPDKSSPKAAQGSGKTYLSQADLDHFRRILLDKLKELCGDVTFIEDEALGKNRIDATGNLSTMPIHMADIGSDTFEQDFALGLMNSERKIVAEIIAALKRIKDETYGICEGTGKPIPKARLEASPWARYCVEYASKIEKGLPSVYEKPRRWKVESENESEEPEVEETEEQEVDEADKEFDALEEDPDLEDLYEVEEGGDEPADEEQP